ncbi:ABC transporter ATP-binding protein [Loigolactobacillus zhaoyuanensis]|uniref:ABC transporter ATP-binding protein n=1 Tax=Loigolactobacillus zhaoyuanensis TaxID=2486017 RepID=A0ABW8UDN3_9LACO|nr:ABC transporter ATP-binding protein [Loigolactobacillus zhaoyuanensis]
MLKIARGRMSIWAVTGAFLFMIVQVISSLNLPSLTANIVNNGVAKGDINYIWRVGAEMVAFALLSVLAAVGNVFLAARTSQSLGQKLRSDIYRKVIGFSNDEFDQVETSSLITRTTNDVVQIQNVAMMALRMMIMAPIMLIGASVLAYSKNHQLTLIFLIVLPLLAIFIGIVMRFAVPLFRAMQSKTDRINLVFREGLTGVRVIRAFRRDKFEQGRFETANQDYTHNAVKVYSIMAVMLPIMTLMMSATNIGITWFGAKLIGDFSMPVGNLIAFMTYAAQILMSFMMLAMVFVFIPRAQASALRIQEVLSLEPTITDQPEPATLPTDFDHSELTYQNVDYRYRGAENRALTDIDFSAKSGQTVAIIGGTGSGKTSLVSLLPRFYDVESGKITLNGTDIRQFSQHDLRDAVSFVPQTAILFTGTVRENMQYGAPDASDEAIWHALEIARADGFIKSEDGLETRVEQGGGNFSGGQRQRLAIARALVKDAAVYVFDDSFSALDFKTDAELRAELREDSRIQNRIVVIVAQRIATVADADLILVLDNGKLVGKGTHAQLKANNAVYQEIMDSQLKEGEGEQHE